MGLEHGKKRFGGFDSASKGANLLAKQFITSHLFLARLSSSANHRRSCLPFLVMHVSHPFPQFLSLPPFQVHLARLSGWQMFSQILLVLSLYSKLSSSRTPFESSPRHTFELRPTCFSLLRSHAFSLPVFDRCTDVHMLTLAMAHASAQCPFHQPPFVVYPHYAPPPRSLPSCPVALLVYLRNNGHRYTPTWTHFSA